MSASGIFLQKQKNNNKTTKTDVLLCIDLMESACQLGT